MNEEFRGPELVRDDEVTRELRAIYAAPADEAYWASLERRIMAALDGADAWWTVSDRWMRVGLVAAGFALAVAGSLYMRSRAQVERRTAYESVMTVEGLDETTIAQRPRLSPEEATLRRLLGNR